MLLIDDFLPEGDLKYRLCHSALWVENRSWQWQYIDAPVVNVFEDFLSYVWKNFQLQDIIGWEYWTKCLTVGDRLDFHSDNNTINPNDLMGHPLKFGKCGLSYYAQNELPDGGYLMIQRDNGEIERIQPKPNRLVIFDSKTPHGVSVINKGIRSSLISVAWDEKPWHYKEDNTNYFETKIL